MSDTVSKGQSTSWSLGQDGALRFRKAIEAEWLTQATRMAGLGHYVWDIPNDRCLYCSDAHARIHGMSAEAYMAQASVINGQTHPDDRPRIEAAFAQLCRGHMFELDYRIVLPDGEERIVREIGQPIFDADGNVVQEIGTCQDITSIRETEATLRETKSALAEGIEALPVGFAIYDPEGHLQVCNQNYRDFLPTSRHLIAPGMSVETLLRHSAPVIAPALGYDDTETYMQERLRAARIADPNRKWQYRQSTGRWVVLSEHRTHAGGFIAIIEDVTEEHQRQEKLNQAQKLEAVGQLSGGIAHDFNNLLAVIQGGLELIADAPHMPDPNLMQDISRATARGRELTRRLLSFSRQQTLSPDQINLNEMVADMINLLERTLGETVAIALDPAPDAWPVSADRGMMENALLNLAINARDAMPAGGALTISTRNTQFGQDLGYPEDFVVLSVTDTGHGMSEDDQARAFDPFFTTKEVGKGSGLGLSMVYGFAEQSGGSVSMTSAVGAGTTISLILPRSHTGPPAPSPQARAAMPHGNGQAILLVEDDQPLRDLTQLMLERLNYHVVSAMDAKAARACLDDHDRFDLILSDVVLPGGTSGPDFVRNLTARHPRPRVVFMSGYVGEYSETIQDLGPDVTLLEKPFGLMELSQTVADTLRGEQG